MIPEQARKEAERILPRRRRETLYNITAIEYCRNQLTQALINKELVTKEEFERNCKSCYKINTRLIEEVDNVSIVADKEGLLIDWSNDSYSKDCSYEFTWKEIIKIAKDEDSNK